MSGYFELVSRHNWFSGLCETVSSTFKELIMMRLIKLSE